MDPVTVRSTMRELRGRFLGLLFMSDPGETASLFLSNPVAPVIKKTKVRLEPSEELDCFQQIEAVSGIVHNIVLVHQPSWRVLR
jgi:hypothetical protein